MGMALENQCSVHCEKFRTLINNSWPILQTSITFSAHASIEMCGIKFILNQRKSQVKVYRIQMIDSINIYHST